MALVRVVDEVFKKLVEVAFQKERLVREDEAELVKSPTLKVLIKLFDVSIEKKGELPISDEVAMEYALTREFGIVVVEDEP